MSGTYGQAMYQYQRQNYDFVKLAMPKGAKAALQAYAKRQGVSLNILILRAVEQQYGFKFDNYKQGTP